MSQDEIVSNCILLKFGNELPQSHKLADFGK